MQGKKTSLHHAAVNGAPFKVMELLLAANPEAVTAADKARSSANASRCPRCCGLIKLPRAPASPPVSSRNRPTTPMHAAPMLRRAPRTQDDRVPLHHAAAKGAPYDVMKLLLNPEAATAVAQARRRAYARRPRRCGAAHHIARLYIAILAL